MSPIPIFLFVFQAFFIDEYYQAEDLLNFTVGKLSRARSLTMETEKSPPEFKDEDIDKEL